MSIIIVSNQTWPYKIFATGIDHVFAVKPLSKAPSLQYRAVEQHRHSSESSTPQQRNFTRSRDLEIRGTIPTGEAITSPINAGAEITPTRSLRDRLGAGSVHQGTNSRLKERRSALERISETPLQTQTARVSPTFESGRLQLPDTNMEDANPEPLVPSEDPLSTERIPATCRLGSSKVDTSRRGTVPLAPRSKAVHKRKVTKTPRKRITRSPLLVPNLKKTVTARASTSTRRLLVVDKDVNLPCDKVGTSQRGTTGQRKKNGQPSTVFIPGSTRDEVSQLVDSAWNSSPLDTVITKLNECRRSIIRWAKEKQEQSNLVIKSRQTDLEKALSSASPDTELIENINFELRRAYLEEEQFWQQRSRIQWLKQGDRNTGFFHAATRTRRIINSIPVLEDTQGGVVYEEEDITRVISNYFNQIFTSSGNGSFARIQGLLTRKVTPEMNAMLTAVPSDSEIKEAVKSINGNKAPGPDGFPATFYQSYWHIIGSDVTKDVQPQTQRRGAQWL
ncbi:hypothetical protein HA466_0311140 [Hirschfeldia incana]|nr:hypothetical protein HA466_0311140 [Hirschfeldia incana]